ncbi:MAG: 6-carboxytetrahydropterin synthase [Armatimonadetes bacterium]|nr:6-carboxytetrahydropterin synthase [Armatimonadota bacterium]
MAVKVSKEFRWEMGHRLPYHEMCRNVHGHSYRMIVEVEGEVDEHGMVVDFADIATAVRPLIEQMDHAFMLDPWDAEMRALLDREGLKKLEVPFYSTAENIAEWVARACASKLAKSLGPGTLAVSVWETHSSCATCLINLCSS